MITFASVAVPTVTRSRTAEPNPFTDAVKSLSPDSGQALAFTVPGTSEREASKSGKTTRYANADLRKALQQLDEAGVEVGVTVRRKVQDDGLVTTVTFWTIPRIVRGIAPVV
jgi:hypothetical protein